ncbi:pentatricopeptide repeat-containing protein At5g10690 isoform X4 [Magnolia sinica]|uniref:pentatricopeptide repeat-containing protein At5g10690 isoform X4 n=1 Tax=Magnolia sinica TaxID=86752 RepID=UPI002658503A|nr:pentatricopeptide repeat-containing protein At5g10690 isoform X4 [Magnolia sinica]
MQHFFPNFIFPNCPPLKPVNSSQFPPPSLSRRRCPLKTNPSKSRKYPSPKLDLRKLTTRVVDLTRRKQLHQIFEEVEHAKRRYGKLNTIVMNAVVEACVHCSDVDSALQIFREMSEPEGCGVDGITFATVLKGYINTDFPLDALTVRDEIFRQGLKPDRLTYNTLVFACVKSGRMDSAMQLFEEMKEEAQRVNCPELFPDAVTYTTLLKGFGNTKDPLSVQKLVVEMKSSLYLFIDRIAYTAMIDALLNCSLTRGALCVFGEIIKRTGENQNLRPKPHLYLSMMRTFAAEGDYDLVKRLRVRMWLDSVGAISAEVQVEADELLMEAAINNGQQISTARQILSGIIRRHKGISWTSRGGMVAVRVEALSGFTSSIFSPYVLPQVSLDDPIEKYMTPFQEANPLLSSLELKQVMMRFFRDAVVPVVDDWGSCVGLIHREDCNQLDASLSQVMRGPPPCITTSTSTRRVIELLLEKRYKMIVIVKSNNDYETSYSSSSKPVGVFTFEQLFKLAIPVSKADESLDRTFM